MGREGWSVAEGLCVLQRGTGDSVADLLVAGVVRLAHDEAAVVLVEVLVQSRVVP